MEAKDRILFYRHYREDVLPAIPFSRRQYRDWLRMTSISTSGIDLNPPDYAPSTGVMAYVNSGRWLWKCPYCGTPTPVEMGEPSICPWCRQSGWVRVLLPENRFQIENVLMQMPGYRDRAGLRAWEPDWTMDVLEDRLEMATAKQAGSKEEILSLSIAPTRDWVPNEILGATGLRNHVNRPLNDIAGRHGVIELEDTFQLPNHTDYALLYLDDLGVITQLSPASSSGIALVSGGLDSAPAFASVIDPVAYVDVSWEADFVNTRIPHTVGSTPGFVTAALVSTSATVNGGYAIGDVVHADMLALGIMQISGLDDTGFQCYRESGSVTIQEKTGTDDYLATPEKWNIRVYLFS